jgi:hypothetical protein
MKLLEKKDVLSIHAAQVARYGAKDGYQSTRTEVHAALQLLNPMPYSDHPPHLPPQTSTQGLKRRTAFTHSEMAEIRAHQTGQVTDAEVMASEKARVKDPSHTDAHHYVQKEHGKALWAEADRLILAAGITAEKGSVS